MSSIVNTSERLPTIEAMEMVREERVKRFGEEVEKRKKGRRRSVPGILRMSYDNLRPSTLASMLEHEDDVVRRAAMRNALRKKGREVS